jgi:dTDP-4-amino-4,6-dideoxygalactose transaminase
VEKSLPTELAVLGGPPAFELPCCVGTPNLGDLSRLRQRCNDILERRWLTNNGRYVQEFEARVAELAGVAHAVAMCNATVALQVLVRALRLTGEVIVPSFTFVATAHALEWEGLRPVFADVDAETHNLDPAQVERLITPQTSAVLGVHLWGRPCAVDELEALTRRHGLELLFDAAHAIGCTHRGRPLGSFGRAEVFSFHATKVANALEGGVVLTADAELAQQLRRMRNFGFIGFDQVVCLGTNAKMHEFSAAMGLCSLEALDEFVAANRRNLEAYRRGLAGLPGLGVIRYDLREKNNFQYAVVEVDPAVCPLDRDELVRVLTAENVVARRYFYPGCHRMEPYQTRYPFWDHTLPVTNRLAGRLMALPTGTAISEADVTRVCALIRLAVRQAAVLRRHWGTGEPAGAVPHGRRPAAWPARKVG